MTLLGLGAASSFTITPDLAQSSETVTLNATAGTPGKDLTFAIDGDQNGTIMSDEHIDTITSDSTTGYNTTTFYPKNYTTADGNYTIYVREETNGDSLDDTSYPINDTATFYDSNGELTVDDADPTVLDVNISNTPIGVNDTGNDQTVNISFSEPIATGTSVTIPDQEWSFDTSTISGTQQGSFWTGTLKEEDIPNSSPPGDPDDNRDDTYKIDVNISGSEDEAGNTLQDGYFTDFFDFDADPPIISWNESISYNLYSGFINFNSLTDPDILDGDGHTEKVYWSTDNHTFTIASPFGDWNSSEAPDGNITVRYRAIDDVGNSDSDTINITLDNTPPNITVHTPVIDRYMKSNETLTIKYSYTEVRPDSSSIVFNNGSAATVYSFNDSGYAGEDGLLSRTINLSTPDRTPGGGLQDNETYDVLVNATDIIDNTGQASAGTVTVDDSAPKLDSAITGNRSNGSSTDRHTITVDFIDTGTGLDPASIDAGDFNVSGLPVSSVDVDGTTARLRVPEQLAANATPVVTMNGTLADRAGNLGGTGSVNATDGIRPELLYAALNTSASTASASVIRMGLTEPVSTNGSTDITINGTTVTTVQELSSTRIQVDLGRQLQTGTHPNITSTTAMTDGAGNRIWLPGGTIEVDTVRRTLDAGWNMVSVPIVDTTTPPVTSVFNTSNIDSVWRYINGSWGLYDPDRPTNDFTTVQGGLGYLVNASRNHTFAPNVNNVRGTGPNGTLPRASITLEAGWALVGQYRGFHQLANTSGAFSTINATTLGSVHTQDGTGNLTYRQVTPANGDAGGSMALPGHGYWAHLDNATSYSWEAVP